MKKTGIFSLQEKENIIALKEKFLDDYFTPLKKLFVFSPFVDESKFNFYVVAGGVFPSIFHGEKINDIDIFLGAPKFTSPSASEWMTYLIQDNEIKKYSRRDLENKTYSNNKHLKKIYSLHVNLNNNPLKIQYIFTDHKNILDMINTFDYLHSRSFFDLRKNTFNTSKKIYSAMEKKKLILINSQYTFQSRKEIFLKRGWIEEASVDNVIQNLLKKITYDTNTL